MPLDPARAMDAYLRAQAYRTHRPEPEPAPIVVEEFRDVPDARDIQENEKDDHQTGAGRRADGEPAEPAAEVATRSGPAPNAPPGAPRRPGVFARLLSLRQGADPARDRGRPEPSP
ncbi:hypothetical protein ACH4U6_20845 [Streptomyces netropsis]|uniref:hypothetical protein n=1 Tax=Streptomyces netropsis TaxID=55404 RepID=UPI0037A586F7